jgi:23S rRNA (cytosine1962-C5)-methyltransferase
LASVAIIPLLNDALSARAGLFDDRHEAALRLFNGFLEGYPGLVVDLYGRTLVLLDHATLSKTLEIPLHEIQEFYLSRFPWLQAMIMKIRHSEKPEERRGVVLFGEQLDMCISENHVWYSLDLRLNQDTSFYLDTRDLRSWAFQNLGGKTVLNTFAYTGSLGVAASAGGARHAIHLDHNSKFLNIARKSYLLNRLQVDDGDFLSKNFFTQTRHFRLTGALFDCVFLDPPLFSITRKGIVDLINHTKQLINKVRPLVAENGWLVVINNALFFSGADFIQILDDLCLDGYLSIETLVPVPPDITGYAQTSKRDLPVDPKPFNYSTKIAILRARHKA